MTRAGLMVFLAVGALSATLLAPALMRTKDKSTRTRCSSNLRQLGLAAIQFADDKHWFPHAGADVRALAGGVESNHATRVVRQLVWNGYHDDPEGFVCAASSDVAGPWRGRMDAWMWAANRGGAVVAPDAPDAPDPALDRTTELSYGWSRRRMNPNVRSTALLAADRATRHEAFRQPDEVESSDPLQGNHMDGVSVLQADGTVNWLAVTDEGASQLVAVDGPGAGLLGVADPTRPRAPLVRPWWRRVDHAGLALVPLGLAGLILLLRALPAARPPAPAAPARRRTRSGRVVHVPPDAPAALQEEQRCPYCHDDVKAEDVLTRCADCAAVFHEECVPAHGVCTTLGCAAVHVR